MPQQLQMDTDLLPFLRYYTGKCDEILSPYAAPPRGEEVPADDRSTDEEMNVAFRQAWRLLEPHFHGKMLAEPAWSTSSFMVGQKEVHTATLTIVDSTAAKHKK